MDKKELIEMQKELKRMFKVTSKRCSDNYSGQTVAQSGIAAAKLAETILEFEGRIKGL